MKFIDSCTLNYLFRSQWVDVRDTDMFFFTLNLATSSSISDKAGVKQNNYPSEIMDGEYWPPVIIKSRKMTLLPVE